MRDKREWTSLARAKRCSACGRNFADGQEYITLLYDVMPAMTREDYCAECGQGLDNEKCSRSFSHWRGRYGADPPEEEPIAKSAIERLLRKYICSREPAHINVCHILALMMERKKKLIPRDRIVEEGTGRRITVYELSETGESFLIEDPGLEVRQAREVQAQVKELMDMEGL